ncbi:MAG: carbohydrate ABC transporter permease [Clostridiaceae bacterium]|jgi:ABC-type glycerol-3-phosphate transport system permease component|nr:carbohydrate ABC transporter permease [Clostridiaceae bacterium]
MIKYRNIRIGKKIRLHFSGSWMIVYLFMIALVTFTSLPLIYMVSTAFKPIEELFVFPPRFFVRRPTLENFSDLMIAVGSSAVPFTRYIFNSFVTAAATVLLTLIVSSLGAYGLAKHKPAGSGIIFVIILGALMFSTHVTQIPSYMVVSSLGMINTYGALIIPKVAVAYNFFLMKQFAEQIPNEYLESARIDGANEITIFVKLVIPFLKPAWATLTVLSFISNWNDYFTPLIFTSSQAMKTLPLALQTIAGGPATSSIGRAGAVAAATFLMTMPTIIIFTSMQAHVMETMVHSGIKA